MDDATKRRLKEQLRHDAESWDQSARGFQDIVRNAIDIDKAIVRELMSAFSVSFRELRGWGAGQDLPDHFNRQAVIAKIHELLMRQLGG